MRLIITRHGETEENKVGIIQGHLPGKLSVEGTDQAKKVALRLKDEEIDFIYSSDLARSANTAREIYKFHPDIPIEFVEDLRERNLGEFQGKKKSDFGWGAKDYKATSLEPKEGETMKEMYDRAKSFLHKVITKHHKDTVLFVGHNGINKALIAVITGESHKDIRGIDNQHNTGVNIFEVDEDGKHKIHVFNCTKHLD